TGHNDILAGAVITNNEKIGERLLWLSNTTGAVLSSFDSWLFIRSLKTLPLRFSKQENNAIKLAEELEKHPNVKEVLYPKRGAMLSFRLNDETKIDKFLRSLKVATFAESLGGVETFVTYPTTQTHFDIPEELRLSYGLTPDLLRVSVGIEDIDDLLEDFLRALEV
ncbi:PLP-dependent transferase, partial [Gemella morbillorum]